MSDTITERYQDQFCTVRRRVGNFNFADPTEKSAQVLVVLPEYDFQHEFKFDPNFPTVEDMTWDKAIYEIISERPRLIGDRDPHERLEEIYENHRDTINTEWKEHREAKLESELESLRSEDT